MHSALTYFVSAWCRGGDTLVSTCQRAGLPDDDTVGFINGNPPEHFVTSSPVYNSDLSYIYLTHANVWESMGKPCSYTQFIKSHIFYYKSCENPYQYCKSRKNPYQVLQVTRESVSGTASHARIRISTASHARIRIRYCKSRENPYQVLQVTCTASEHAIKSKVRMIKSLP